MLRRRRPEPPKGVRIVTADGDTIPVELVYDGVDADGCHSWSVTAAIPVTPGAHLEVERMPPHTSLRVLVARVDHA